MTKMANLQNFGVYDDKYNVQWISSIKAYTKKAFPLQAYGAQRVLGG
jgi:hypothetical protein